MRSRSRFAQFPDEEGAYDDQLGLRLGRRAREELLMVATETEAAGGFINAPLFPLSDIKVIVPFWNARYYHSGITHGQNEPQVADSALVVNGRAITH